jgi:hypothetical protein
MVTGGQREKLLVLLTSVKPDVDGEGGWTVEDGQRMMPHVGAVGDALAWTGKEGAGAVSLPR